MPKKSLAIAAQLMLLAIIAVGAGAAQGAATTTAAEFYTGASPGTTLTTPQTFNGSVKSGTNVLFKSKVGSSLTPVELVATGASCSSCTIENKEVTSKTGKVAYGSGKVLFTGVTVSTPANCKVISEAGVTGQVITKALVGHGDFMNGSTAVVQAIPTAGASTSFATVELENNGGTCPVSGLYAARGTVFCDWFWATGTFARIHGCLISPSVETNDGGGLLVGSQSLEVTGTGEGSLGSGSEWTIK